MKEKIKTNEQDNKDLETERIEKEICEKVMEITKGKELTKSELNKIIEDEIKNRNYCKEDWHIYYAIERIKETIKPNFIPALAIIKYIRWGVRVISFVIFALFFFFIFVFILSSSLSPSAVYGVLSFLGGVGCIYLANIISKKISNLPTSNKVKQK